MTLSLFFQFKFRNKLAKLTVLKLAQKAFFTRGPLHHNLQTGHRLLQSELNLIELLR